MSWKPVKRCQPDVLGVNSQYSGLLDVRIPLEGEITSEWENYFLNPIGIGISLSMHPPRLVGNAVRIKPPDDEIDSYVKHVDERVEAANQRYLEEQVPRLKREEQQQEAAQKRTTDRLTAARNRLTNL